MCVVCECVCSSSDDLSAFTKECGFVLLRFLVHEWLRENKNLDAILIYVVDHAYIDVKILQKKWSMLI